MKVALLFFGLTRSLKYTISSINSNILDVFKKNNIDYDIYLYTYKLKTYINRRAGEKTNNYDNDEYKLLSPNYLQKKRQQMLQKRRQLQKRDRFKIK